MKAKYEELEVDSNNIATHWIERDGLECWAENEYYPDGKIKDVHIVKMLFHEGWTSNWFGKTYTENEMWLFDHNSGIAIRDVESEVLYAANKDMAAEFSRMYTSGEVSRIMVKSIQTES